jgi:hypothetical protein
MSESKEVATLDEPREGVRRVMASLESGQRVAPIVPRNVEEAFRIAQAVVNAGLAPASYERDAPNPDKLPDVQKILIGILKGAEVGLPPITALSTIAIINKRPCIWGDGAVALCQQSGHVEKVEQKWEGEDGKEDWAAVYRIWRRGQSQPYEGRFSVKDAKRAGLWMKRSTWVQYPQRMLMARARAYALRDGFADCLMGLSIAEEMRDLPAEPQMVDKSFLEDSASDAPQITHQPEEPATDPDFAEVDEEPVAVPAEPEDTFPGDLPFPDRAAE